MVASAKRFAGELPAVPMPLLEELEAGVRAKASPTDVSKLCSRIRASAVSGYAIATAPALPPSYDKARTLFQANCVQCHGPEGRGDGPEAKKHDPRPANLHDPERMAAVTPYRAYCDLTYGIAGTAMPALNVPAADRWSLAFYATSLLHEQARAEAPRGPSTALPRIGLATLANATAADLDALLAKSVPDADQRRAEVARLRAVAPFEATAGETPLGIARRAITEARELALAGKTDEADRRVLDGYLQGIEEIEAPLRAHDALLVDQIEDSVSHLRSAISHHASGEIREAAAGVLSLLDRAEQKTDTQSAGMLLLALTSAVLILREGLEAALIVASILAVIRRVGLPRSAALAVHGGWMAALGAGAITFALARTVLHSLALSREMLEGVTGVLAAVVLFFTSFWLIAKADSKRWIAYVKSRAGANAATGGLFGIFGLAFLAAYREAFETVLFYEALLAGDAARVLPLAAGAVAGAAVLAFAAYGLGRVERRLPIGPFFASSGALLSGLSIVLLGHGIHGLEAGGALVPHPVSFPRIAWLGVYPDAISLGAQAVVLGLVLVVTVGMRLRPARAEVHAG
jgi:high-affinity iron transporter